MNVEQLWALLSDGRAAVRQRASRSLVRQRESPAVREFVAHLAELGLRGFSEHQPAGDADSSDAPTAALARLWTLCQIDSAVSRQCIRQLLEHEVESIRHAALHAVSLNRDADAAPQIVELLTRDSAANRRTAAEALGRIGDKTAVPHLLAAAAQADDRILQHSVTYALIELNEAEATRAGLVSREPRTVGAALVALDQMPSGAIEPKQVVPLLSSSNDELRQTARWLVTQHTEWGSELAAWFRGQLAAIGVADQSPASHATDSEVLESMLVSFTGNSAIQELLADVVRQPESSNAARMMALRAMAAAKLSQPPREWREALSSAIKDRGPELLPLAVSAARALPPVASPDALHQALANVAEAPQYPQDLRVAAMAVVTNAISDLSEPQFTLLLEALSRDNPVALRSAAADAVSHARLSAVQLEQLCDAIVSAGPLELSRLLPPFAKSTDERLGRKLLASLTKASALSSLRVDLVRETLAGYDPDLQRDIDKLESAVNIDAARSANESKSCFRIWSTETYAVVTLCITVRKPRVLRAIVWAMPAGRAAPS